MRKFTLFALMIILSAVLLIGCGKKGDKVASVALKDNDPNTAIETRLGEFELDAYTLLVTYESGSTEEITLTEDMIEEADIFKLYQVGEHDITINYEKQKYIFKLSIKRATFGELSFPKNNVFTYDGEAHVIEVDGNIPANATVTYIGGNSFVNAGTYDVTAVVSCEGYVTEKLSTSVRIEPAKHDMSGVKLEGMEVTYDGNAHSLEISGALPEGVSEPTYMINDKAGSSATDAGEYKVIAMFNNSDPNYEPIPEMEATLKITPAEYVVKGVEIIFKDDDGDVLSDATKIYDGKSIIFDLNDHSKLSKKISVSYSVSDKDGNVISTSNKKTEIVNAGVYTVKAEFTIEGSKNYKPIEPITRTFEVKKAKYDTSKIHFDSDVVDYDGEEHSLILDISGYIDIEGADVTYEYYLDGERVESGKEVGVDKVGKYTVKAIIALNNENYEVIEAFEATLEIEGESEPELEPDPIS
ncbi:MAG: hypothetical protein J6U68_00540 [Clostridia bacterium]|nr:hypothetical protein [Clostridia bacterium]